jgi:hypothetical protein
VRYVAPFIVALVDAWLRAAGISSGPLFRGIRNDGSLHETALSVFRIVVNLFLVRVNFSWVGAGVLFVLKVTVSRSSPRLINQLQTPRPFLSLAGVTL